MLQLCDDLGIKKVILRSLLTQLNQRIEVANKIIKYTIKGKLKSCKGYGRRSPRSSMVIQHDSIHDRETLFSSYGCEAMVPNEIQRVPYEEMFSLSQNEENQSLYRPSEENAIAQF
uniref:Uncharacterized protein n=1 Tax=Cannabis sativa TaxID=3483 RepID=A0A803QDI9_CANSA